MFIQDCFNRLL